MSFRFIDYNEMLVKPADVDVIAIFDIDAGPGGELKKIKFGTWKSFFAMRDENCDINADYEFQTNKKLKHGSAGEYEQYHDATDMYFVSTIATGKMIFKLNSLTALTFYPATTSIGIGTWHLNNDGSANKGIYIDSNGDLHISTNKNIEMHGGNIDMGTGTFINADGLDNKGLEFLGTGGAAKFLQNLTVVGWLYGLGSANISGSLEVSGGYSAQGIPGVTFNGAVTTLNVKDGIVVGHT